MPIGWDICLRILEVGAAFTPIVITIFISRKLDNNNTFYLNREERLQEIYSILYNIWDYYIYQQDCRKSILELYKGEQDIFELLKRIPDETTKKEIQSLIELHPKRVQPLLQKAINSYEMSRKKARELCSKLTDKVLFLPILDSNDLNMSMLPFLTGEFNLETMNSFYANLIREIYITRKRIYKKSESIKQLRNLYCKNTAELRDSFENRMFQNNE